MIKSTIKRLETLLKNSKDFSLTEKKAILKEVSKGVKQKPELQDKFRVYLCPNCREVQFRTEKRCPYCGQRLDWRAAEREDKNNETGEQK